MKLKLFLLVGCVVTLPLAAVQCAFAASGGDANLTPHFLPGQRFGNVFSRTFDLMVKGFPDDVYHWSGTGTYLVVSSKPDATDFYIDDHYDGLSEEHHVLLEMRDQGAIGCRAGKCQAVSDASDLIYLPKMWGTPPRHLRVGMTWQVRIAQPWELGPPGTETVTVRSMDSANHTVTLKREGEGSGAFMGEPPIAHLTRNGKKIAVKMSPGATHWVGYATFREGILQSDEIMTTQKVTLRSDTLGTLRGEERQYVLQNAMPVSG